MAKYLEPRPSREVHEEFITNLFPFAVEKGLRYVTVHKPGESNVLQPRFDFEAVLDVDVKRSAEFMGQLLYLA